MLCQFFLNMLLKSVTNLMLHFKTFLCNDVVKPLKMYQVPIKSNELLINFYFFVKFSKNKFLSKQILVARFERFGKQKTPLMLH